MRAGILLAAGIAIGVLGGVVGMKIEQLVHQGWAGIAR